MAFVESEGVFTSEAALLPDFLPDEPLHREAQLSELSKALLPATKSIQPDNLFLFGGTGTGKTTCAKYTIKQLEDYKPKINPIYINCWDNNTRLSVLSQIAGGIDIGFPRRGLASDEVFSRIVEMTKRNDSTNIIFLDEFDQLCLRKEESVAYDLTRAGENYGVNFAVVLISNNSNLLETMDKRITSSLYPHKIEFPKYSPAELKDILRERAKEAFRPGSWNEEVIALCAAHCAKTDGDCRTALKLLWRAARKAEASGHITVEHVKSAFNEREQSEKPEANNEIQNEILNLLKQNLNGLNSGEIYEKLKDKYSERTLRTHLTFLTGKNFIDISEIQGKELGGRGRSRMVKLKK